MIIEPHYNGPHAVGHGGTSAGRFAELVEADAACVRFHRPVPLGTELVPVAAADAGAVTLTSGEQAIATVSPLARPLAVAPMPMPARDAIERAERTWLDDRDGDHLCPTCFGCGHERLVGGLGLRPGRAAADDLFACRWRPEGIGRLPAWLVWAALDCPTGFPALQGLAPDQAIVTGELAVQILEPVHAGRTYRILSRLVDTDGRRRQVEAALYRADGRRSALARATWLTVPRPAAIDAAA